MASSPASTTAGRRRTHAKSKHRTRAARPKPASARRPPAKKKPASAKKPPAKAKPRGTQRAKPTAKSRRRSIAAPRTAISRTLTIALCVGGAVVALATAYLFWFRDSGLVAVEKVGVEGIEGPEAEAVTAALTEAGKKMTTLSVDESELAAAASGFPTVVAVEAKPDFPHGLVVEVTSRPPVLSASDGGPPVAVAADGTLLHGVEAGDGLPSIDVDSLPAKGTLSGEPLALAEVAGAAPDPLRPLIDDLSFASGEIEVVLKGGIPVKFGDAEGAGAKWEAVAAVLANPQVKTLTHLDVRVPERPAIGGAAPPVEPE